MNKEEMEAQLKEEVIGMPRFVAELSIRIGKAIGPVNSFQLSVAALVLQSYVDSIKQMKEFDANTYEFAQHLIKPSYMCSKNAGDDVSEERKMQRINAIDGENRLRKLLDK